MTQIVPKLGIVAGGGALPLQIVQACTRAGQGYHIVAIDEFADQLPPGVAHTRIPASKIGATIKTLKREGCNDVAFAGKFVRPNGKNMKIRPDLGGLEFIVRMAGMFGRNDDAIHRAISNMFAARNLRIVSPLDAAPDLAARAGCITKSAPPAGLKAGFQEALRLAKRHGATKQGQAVVVERGAIIARETRAGTDAMLTALSEERRPDAFLVKAMTPTQLTTLDPPAIGESTVVNAARAGLAGILVEAGRSVVVDETAVRAKADELGIFVCAESLNP